MATPTGVQDSCLMCIELCTNGTDWQDFTDYLTVITPAAITRDTGEQATFGSDTKLMGVGKRNPFEVTIRGVYTDGSTTADPMVYCWTQFTGDCGGMLGIQWAPHGCDTDVTAQAFATASATTDISEIISFTPPGGDADDGSPILWEAVVRAPVLYRLAYS